MRQVPLVLLACFLASICSDRGMADLATPVVEIGSVADLQGYTPPAPPASPVEIHLASYNCASGPPCQSDGGEGLLVKHGTGCDGTNTDGGSTFYDAATDCWYRENLNGDLRQWGMTQ